MPTRYYATLFRETGTGRVLTLVGQGNTQNSGARSARKMLTDAVGDTARWYEVATRYVPNHTPKERTA